MRWSFCLLSLYCVFFLSELQRWTGAPGDDVLFDDLHRGCKTMPGVFTCGLFKGELKSHCTGFGCSSPLIYLNQPSVNDFCLSRRWGEVLNAQHNQTFDKRWIWLFTPLAHMWINRLPVKTSDCWITKWVNSQSGQTIGLNWHLTSFPVFLMKETTSQTWSLHWCR